MESAHLKDALRDAEEAATASPGARDARDARRTARDALTAWQAGTRRLAFLGSVVLGVLVAGLGVRALGLFVDPGEFADLREGQRVAFHMMDVLLTAGVLAGGSDALHQFVTTFTDFMTKTRQTPA